jgi:hypothetical protein
MALCQTSNFSNLNMAPSCALYKQLAISYQLLVHYGAMVAT